MSALGQKRTFYDSLDQFIGALLELKRNVEPERLGGLEVNHQFELDRGLDGKLARLFALEDAIDIGCRSPIRIDLVNSVGQQAAEFSEGSARIDSRETGAGCQRYDLCTMDVRKGIRHHDQAAIRRAGLCGNGRLERACVLNRGCDRLRMRRIGRFAVHKLMSAKGQ